MTHCNDPYSGKKTPGWVCVLGGLLAAISGSIVLLVISQTIGLLPSLAGITPTRHVGWPIIMFVVGLGLVTSAWPCPKSRLLQRWQLVTRHLAQLWRQRGIVWRLVFCAVLAHVAISLVYLFESPADLNSTLAERAALTATPFRIRSGERYVHWEFFAPQWKQTIPPGAAVAYRGYWEGPLVAYELYPRRLYLLPEDARRLAANWHNHRWLTEKTKGKSFRDRWTDEFWLRRTSWPTFDLASFVRARNIEFLVTFDETNEQGCSLARIEDFLSRKDSSKVPSPVKLAPE